VLANISVVSNYNLLLRMEKEKKTEEEYTEEGRQEVLERS
jgi:hypothetical protein